MKSTIHVAITSVTFDDKAEGILTGRLVRALLDYGYRVTVITSTKAKTSLRHPLLTIIKLPHGPREPRAGFDCFARVRGHIVCNFYLWSRRASQIKFSEENTLHVFYGRAMPFSSLIPAYHLAQQYNRPLILHFSDPIPHPDSAQLPPVGLQAIVDAAQAITFTNHQTIDYQQSLISFDPEIARVLLHIGPEPSQWGEDLEQTQPRYLFAGSVRPHHINAAQQMLRGFALHLQTNPLAKFVFLGTRLSSPIRSIIAELNIINSVEELPFTQSPKLEIRRASALVFFDPIFEKPLWTTTKFVEYLMTDKPILAITSKGSPADEFLSRHPQTSVVTLSSDINGISDGFDKLTHLKYSADAYANRFSDAEIFSPAAVAKQFSRLLADLIK